MLKIMNKNIDQNEAAVSQQELDAIMVARNKLLINEMSKQIAELELKNLILQTYVRHGLTEKDVIDETTGKIKKIP